MLYFCARVYLKSSPHKLNGVMILFYILRKKTVLMGVVFAAAVAGIAVCGILHQRHERAQTVFSVPVSGKVVVVDAGHGGFDGGAKDNGIVEKEVNLDVALRLKEYIEQGGGVAVLTRSEDVSTASPGTAGKSAKRSDLEERKKLAESSNADIFVSIHMNKFPQTQYKGAQVFYGSEPEDGKKLGEEIQESLREILKDSNQRSAKKTDGSIFLLKNTTIPSVIVECGFLSNPQEAQLLRQDAYRRKLAWAIYLGITKYFNQ